jgi:hypothetical protein
VSSPAEQALLKASRDLTSAKAAFEAADQALTVACKAYMEAKTATEAYVSDFAARCSR